MDNYKFSTSPRLSNKCRDVEDGSSDAINSACVTVETNLIQYLDTILDVCGADLSAAGAFIPSVFYPIIIGCANTEISELSTKSIHILSLVCKSSDSNIEELIGGGIFSCIKRIFAKRNRYNFNVLLDIASITVHLLYIQDVGERMLDVISPNDIINFCIFTDEMIKGQEKLEQETFIKRIMCVIYSVSNYVWDNEIGYQVINFFRKNKEFLINAESEEVVRMSSALFENMYQFQDFHEFAKDALQDLLLKWFCEERFACAGKIISGIIERYDDLISDFVPSNDMFISLLSETEDQQFWAIVLYIEDPLVRKIPEHLDYFIQCGGINMLLEKYDDFEIFGKISIGWFLSVAISKKGIGIFNEDNFEKCLRLLCETFEEEQGIEYRRDLVPAIKFLENYCEHNGHFEKFKEYINNECFTSVLEDVVSSETESDYIRDLAEQLLELTEK